MADSAQKLAFLQNAQNIANTMALLDAQIKDAGQVLVNNGWNAGGADPISAADIPGSAGFTVAEALAFFTVVAKYNALMNGSAISADSTVRAAIDKMRSKFGL